MVATNPNEFKKLVNKANELGLGSGLDELKQLKPLNVKKDNIFMRILKEAYFAEGTKLGDGARIAYDWEDKIFKLARFKKNLEKGMEPALAMKDAQYHYVDYSTPFNGTLRLLDKSGLMPFLHYSVKSTPMVLKAIIKNPVRFMMLQAALMGSGASAWLGDNEDENYAKPKWAESGAFANLFGVKSWSRISESGWYLNLGRLAPGFRFDGLDKLEFSGGFVKGIANIAGGKSTLGYSIESEDDNTLERIFKRSKEALKSYFPPITFGRYGQQLAAVELSKYNLAQAPKDYNQDDLSTGEILLRGAGVREFNQKKEYKKELNKTKKHWQIAVSKNNNQEAKKLEIKFSRIKEVAQKDGFKFDIKLIKKRDKKKASQN